jgi:hypothetical protein
MRKSAELVIRDTLSLRGTRPREALEGPAALTRGKE